MKTNWDCQRVMNFFTLTNRIKSESSLVLVSQKLMCGAALFFTQFFYCTYTYRKRELIFYLSIIELICAIEYHLKSFKNLACNEKHISIEQFGTNALDMHYLLRLNKFRFKC
jgi:hypothetical protein